MAEQSSESLPLSIVTSVMVQLLHVQIVKILSLSTRLNFTTGTNGAVVLVQILLEDNVVLTF